MHSVEVKPIEKKIHAEFNVDAFNEVQPLARAPQVETEVNTHIEKKIVHENVQPVVVKEVSNIVWNLHSKSEGQKVILVYGIQGPLGTLLNIAYAIGNLRFRQKSEHNYEHAYPSVAQVCSRVLLQLH